MTRFLSLDIGDRRTGVAFSENPPGFVMALKTILAKNSSDLITAILSLIQEKGIDRLVIGLPLLPDGTEGEQAAKVRTFTTELSKQIKVPVLLLDERYSSYGATKESADSKAACSLLEIALERSKMGIDKSL